jgi:hypothetical protein
MSRASKPLIASGGGPEGFPHFQTIPWQRLEDIAALLQWHRTVTVTLFFAPNFQRRVSPGPWELS